MLCFLLNLRTIQALQELTNSYRTDISLTMVPTVLPIHIHFWSIERNKIRYHGTIVACIHISGANGGSNQEVPAANSVVSL